MYDYQKMIDKQENVCIDIFSRKDEPTLRLIALCILSFRSKFNRYPTKFHYYKEFDWEVKAAIMTSPAYRNFTDIVTVFGLQLTPYPDVDLINYRKIQDLRIPIVNGELRQNMLFVSDGEDSVMGIF